MKTTTTWFVVADGGRAHVLVNIGPGKDLYPIPEKALTHPMLAGRDIMSDRPGRTFDSVGRGRHHKEPRTDPRKVEKRNFAQKIATLLDDGLNQGEFERLVIVAPPEELGLIRAELSPAVSRRVSAELNKDLAGLSQSEIMSRLSKFHLI